MIVFVVINKHKKGLKLSNDNILNATLISRSSRMFTLLVYTSVNINNPMLFVFP